MDDLLITSNDSEAILSFKQHLRLVFHMKDLGHLKYFLGIKVACSSKGIYLCQWKYELDILTNTGLLGAKPMTFPMEQNHSLGKAKGPIFSSPDSYRRLMGRLIYLIITRSDLAYSIHTLAQFKQQP